jgi:hypothetical protein
LYIAVSNTPTEPVADDNGDESIRGMIVERAKLEYILRGGGGGRVPVTTQIRGTALTSNPRLLREKPAINRAVNDHVNNKVKEVTHISSTPFALPNVSWQTRQIETEKSEIKIINARTITRDNASDRSLGHCRTMGPSIRLHASLPPAADP